MVVDEIITVIVRTDSITSLLISLCLVLEGITVRDAAA